MRKALCVELYEARLRIRIGRANEFDGYVVACDAMTPKLAIDRHQLTTIFHQMGLPENVSGKGEPDTLDFYAPLTDYAEEIGDDTIITWLSVEPTANGNGLDIRVTVDNGHGETWTSYISYNGSYAVMWDTEVEQNKKQKGLDDQGHCLSQMRR